MNRNFYALGAVSFMAIATAGLTACDRNEEVTTPTDQTDPQEPSPAECRVGEECPETP